MKPDRAKFLTETEFRALLRAARGRGAGRGARDYLLLALAGNLGLRVTEAVSLRAADFRLERRPPFVRVASLKAAPRGRRRKSEAPVHHDLTLSPKLARLVARYLARLRRRGASGDFCLFPATDRGDRPADRPMSARAAENIFRRAADLAGLDAQVSFHALRHYRGSFLYAKTRDLNYVRRRMRHRSLGSTYVYMHLDPETERELDDAVPTIL